MRKTVIAALSVMVLSIYACSTTPTYGPASSAQGVGYSEVALEQNRYRVTFRGGDAALAQDYALRRSAELTIQKGYDWFEVVNAYTQREGDGRSGTRVSVGGSTGSYRSGVGIGIGFPIGGSSPEMMHTYEILMGSGEKPTAPNVYDARAIAASLSRPQS